LTKPANKLPDLGKSEVHQRVSQFAPPAAALTIASMPALIIVGSVGHASMTLAKSAHAGTAPFGAEVVLLPDSSATGSATGSCSLAKRFDVFGLREVGSGLLREQLPSR
jgi:hypothetical protein